MNVKENELQKLLRKQYLITAFIENKLQVVNYIKEGYDNNAAVLINNHFLHFTAHVYYRSIIIDLYALFGQATGRNKNSFFHIRSKHTSQFVDGSVEKLHEWIENERSHISVIQKLRGEQIAHYDFTVKESISLNFDQLDSLNTLYDLAVKLISFCGGSLKQSENSIAYDLGRRHSVLKSLSRLIAKKQGE